MVRGCITCESHRGIAALAPSLSCSATGHRSWVPTDRLLPGSAPQRLPLAEPAPAPQRPLLRDRYFPCLLDPAHAADSMRYVEFNPVRAEMVESVLDY